MKYQPQLIFYRANEWLYKLEAALLVATTLFIMIFAFAPIVLRAAFDKSWIWAPELNRHLVLWITFLGANLAIKDNKHISLEVLTQFLPAKYLPWIRVLIYAFTFIICGRLTFIAFYYYQFEKFNINMGDYLFGTFAKTYFKIVYPLGFGAMTYHYVIHFLQALTTLFFSKPNSK